MLIICKSLRELEFDQLAEVYEETLAGNGKLFFPKEEPSRQKILASDNLYTYLREVFFANKRSFYAVWQDKCYVSALRVEPYKDGYLISALETSPSQRGNGFAKMLICGIENYLTNCKLYSHICNRNYKSRRVHEACGFRKILDYACYIDGTVSRNASTYVYECIKVLK